MTNSYQIGNHYRRHIPQRPDNPRAYSEFEASYWYDEEYVGWDVVKLQLPKWEKRESQGLRLSVLCQGKHPYWFAYEKGLRQESQPHGIIVDVYYADWDQEVQTRQLMHIVENALADILVIAPVEIIGGTECIQYAYEHKIPIIASNQTLQRESYRKILSWTGPDEWGQNRLLAQEFAKHLSHEGGYCIVSHYPNCSTYLARTWGVITELTKIAPSLQLLEKKFTSFNRELTRQTVHQWLERYGNRLKGIVCSDDGLPQEGILRALQEKGREDIVCVANGATQRGLNFIQNGKLVAATWQPPHIDGALPIKVIVDWVKGLQVSPFVFIQPSIVTKSTVDSFLAKGGGIEDFHKEDLQRMILEGRIDEITGFFEDIERRLCEDRSLSEAYIGGFAIEVISSLLHISETHELNIVSRIGGYEFLYKGIVHQKEMIHTLTWIKELSYTTVSLLMERHKLTNSIVDRIVAYISLHYHEPFSLKTLSSEFELSAPYIGKLFKETLGISFSQYVHEYRIKKARELLEETPMKIKEIAKAVGFSDVGYFATIFKKITGHSPTEYH